MLNKVQKEKLKLLIKPQNQIFNIANSIQLSTCLKFCTVHITSYFERRLITTKNQNRKKLNGADKKLLVDPRIFSTDFHLNLARNYFYPFPLISILLLSTEISRVLTISETGAIGENPSRVRPRKWSGIRK